MERNALPDCPICQSAGSPTSAPIPKPVFQCSSCHHIYLADGTTGSGVQEVDPLSTEATYAGRNRALVRRLGRLGIFGDGLRTLDFGAGVGHISSAAKAQYTQAEVICIEASPRSVEWLRQRGHTVVSTIQEVPPSWADSLLLCEVVEHLDDPVAVLTELRTRLRPGGIVLVTTPAGETRRGSRNTNAYETPEHVQFFTETSLAELLRTAGFGKPHPLVLSQLYPTGDGWRGRVVSQIKGLVRPVRAWILGPHHLVVTARAVVTDKSDTSRDR